MCAICPTTNSSASQKLKIKLIARTMQNLRTDRVHRPRRGARSCSTGRRSCSRPVLSGYGAEGAEQRSATSPVSQRTAASLRLAMRRTPVDDVRTGTATIGQTPRRAPERTRRRAAGSTSTSTGSARRAGCRAMSTVPASSGWHPAAATMRRSASCIARSLQTTRTALAIRRSWLHLLGRESRKRRSLTWRAHSPCGLDLPDV